MTLGRRSAWKVGGAWATLAALCTYGALATGACSSSPAEPFGTVAEAGTDTPAPNFGDSAPTPVDDDQYSPPVDSAPPANCPGTAIPPDTSAACVVDTSASCPSCASWGYVCPGGSSPEFADAAGFTPGSLCRASALDAGGTLVCCTEPACILTPVDPEAGAEAGCTAPQTKHFACLGSAVPSGTCAWSGPSAPNDYCCQ